MRSCGPGDDLGALRAQLAKASLVVDALLGTGLNAPVEGAHAALIDLMNAAGAPILSVDIASRLSSDTGRPLGAAVRATVTATFGHPKVGQVLYPGIEHTGELEVVDIGLAVDGLASVGPTAHVLDPCTVGAHSAPPARRAQWHVGHLPIARLARQRARRARDGRRRPRGRGPADSRAPPAAAGAPRPRARAMTAALPDGRDGTAALGDGAGLMRLLETAVVCGPGLELNPDTRTLVATIPTCTGARSCSTPS